MANLTPGDRDAERRITNYHLGDVTHQSENRLNETTPGHVKCLFETDHTIKLEDYIRRAMRQLVIEQMIQYNNLKNGLFYYVIYLNKD